jgi:3-oxoacyl-[acyl-carrier-protein] synthase-3
MNGRQVYRFATQVIASAIEETIAKADLTIDDIALIVPHQANVRIIETAAKRLKIPVERFFMNVDTMGNTSAASIPIALCDAVHDGRLRPDDNVVFVGFGGGLTWAASVVKWNVTPPTVSLPRREWRRARYIVARGRSQARKWRRKIIDSVSISPRPHDQRRDADK